MTEPSTTQRDDLAHEIFIADNYRVPSAAREWDAFRDIGGVCDGDYARNIADGLVAKGYRKLDPTDETAFDKVAAIPVTHYLFISPSRWLAF